MFKSGNVNIFKYQYKYFFLLIILVLMCLSNCKNKRKRHFRYQNREPKGGKFATKAICMQVDNTLKARHKSCFLRPDTGPCRADIIQWYYDVKQGKCYRFFWGGCQGNGNRFESQNQCIDYCTLNSTSPPSKIPHYCSLSFEYGTCFGLFYRWAWDRLTKTCKRYMYSGCGGNQNNFQTRAECLDNCVNPPNNTLQGVFSHLTTCIPLNFGFR